MNEGKTVTNDFRRLIASLEIVTAAGFILSWATLLFIGMAPENPPACYFAYKYPFLLPDGVLCILLLISGVLLMKGREMGFKLSLIAAGGLVFLGLVDLAFNIQNGVYSASALDLVINGLLNAWCVGFGLFIIIALR